MKQGDSADEHLAPNSHGGSGPEEFPQPALVIMAHSSPQDVRRLIDVCRDQPVILHCDSKTPPAVFDSMTTGLPERVLIAPRHDTRLASWSLVRAELACIKLALDRTDAEHVIVMSGSDYPLMNPDKFASVLGPFIGTSWLDSFELPYRPWDVPMFRDGGLWRLRHYFPTRHDQVFWLRPNKPIFVPVPRRVHPDLAPRASSAWKIISRPDAQKLIKLLDSRPDLVSFGRSTFIPEESFIASVLASESLWGADALAPCSYFPCLANWPETAATHPGWFSVADIPRIQEALQKLANSGDAAAKKLPNEGVPLYGRKFTSRHEPELLDKLEAALW
jgi:hypothetical protein